MSELTASVIDLEDELVSHLAISESAMYLYQERFAEALVNEPIAKQMFAWTMDFIKQFRQPPARSVLAHEFPADEFPEPQVPIEYLVGKFRERYSRNEAQAVIKKLARTVNHDPEETSRLGYAEFHRIRKQTASRSGKLDQTDFVSVVDQYEQIEQIELVPFGLRSLGGVESVDDVLSGLRKGCLYYIIGRPKTFKSFLLLQSAVAAYQAGHHVVFYSLEMTTEEMMQRAACLVSNTSWSAFVKHKLMPQQLDRMRKVSEKLHSQPGFNLIHPARGERTVQALLDTALEYGAEAVYVDQLKFVESSRPIALDMRHREIEYINEEMKDAAEQMPWFVAAQFNREAASLSEMGDLAKIGLSDSIGQTADMLLGLYQTKDMRTNHLVEFGTIESRSYEHARWHIHVELSTGCQFRVIDRVA